MKKLLVDLKGLNDSKSVTQNLQVSISVALFFDWNN